MICSYLINVEGVIHLRQSLELTISIHWWELKAAHKTTFYVGSLNLEKQSILAGVDFNLSNVQRSEKFNV